ncbi:hypothetical protein V6E02_03310 [Thiobacter sp. AK1]|uniref:Uncharacterized protein n=1 Tax=Thiobacter aerophilum TaxID=3121275 RepID=A0ABV0EEI9_9BURK
MAGPGCTCIGATLVAQQVVPLPCQAAGAGNLRLGKRPALRGPHRLIPAGPPE